MCITASIVLYKNTADEVDKLIAGLLECRDLQRILLIDNSPTAFLEEKYSTFHSRVSYIFTHDNRGYGAGHNIAIKKGNNKVKYHIVMNPDIICKGEVITEIMNFMDKNESVGLVQPKIIFPNGDLQYLCKLLPTPMNLIARRFSPLIWLNNKLDYVYELRFSGYNTIMNVPYLSGCFMFLRMEALSSVGLFDENIFMYLEDADLTRRIHKKYKTIFYPAATVIHRFQKGSHKNLRLLWIAIKSAMYYFNKWGWFFDIERKRINKKVKDSILFKLEE